MAWLIRFFTLFFPNLFKGLGAFLVGFITPLVTPVITFLTGFFKKTVLFGLVVAAIYAGIEAFLYGIMEALSMVDIVSSEFFEVGRMFFPSNFKICLTVLVLAKIKSLVFFWVHRLSEKFLHT